ncbi:MAG: tetratricopeptide repeat-containing sulfotransferase family protein [Alphaproteobacteria bacterium]
MANLLTQAGELIDAGRFPEAIVPMTEAAQLVPDNARIQTDLGALYIEAGRPEDALEPLERAITLNPRIAIAYWRLGTAFEMLGDMQGAVEALEHAVQIRPTLSDAHGQLALLYKELGRRREAIESYQRAARSSENQAGRHFAEAQSRLTEGRVGEAENLLRRALETEPGLTTARGLLGQILVSRGHLDEAVECFEAQIRATPNAGLPYYDLVRCKHFTTADESFLKQIDNVLQEPGVEDINRLLLLLARGLVLGDLGHYELAMKSFDEASDLRTRVFSIDIRAFEAEVDKLIAVFTRQMLERVSTNSDRTPVLFVGMPRSGLSVVERMVASHPEVKSAGERPFWRNRLQTVLGGGAETISADFLSQVSAEYLGDLRAASQTAARISDREPLNFLAVGLIHLAFPAASIIHCRRKPIETAVAIHQVHLPRSTGMPTGGEDLVRYFHAYRKLMEHWRRVLPAERLLEVDHERMTAWPEPDMRKLIDLIGLPWDDTCVAPHMRSRLVRTAGGWQLRQSSDPSASESWRRYQPWLGALAPLVDEPA